MQHRPLRLVVPSDIRPDDGSIECSKNANRNLILEEASELIARFGPNSYATYLLRHERRPDAKAARIMGLAIGCRVRASDGSLQPALSQAEQQARATLKRENEKRLKSMKTADEVAHAIATLCTLQPTIDTPLLKALWNRQNPSLFSEIDYAINILNRIAEEMKRDASVPPR